MMNRKALLLIALTSFLLCSFLSRTEIWAQPRTHVVQKGDTLWDICEKYYGNPTLWPKLWQMNPFITNPHLLDPGDVITLLEEVPVKEEKKAPVKKPVKAPLPLVTGIDVSGMTNVNAIGYLSVKKVRPWGNILSSQSGKLMLSKGDTVFVKIDGKEGIRSGDEFSIGQYSPLLKHPVTGQPLGYAFNVFGILVIEKPAGVGYMAGEFYEKKGMYQAKILEAYRTLHVGDFLIPYESVSACVQPVSMDRPLVGNIVAARDQLQLIGPQAVVYIDHGFNQGVRRGHIFQVVRTKILDDPDAETTTILDKPKIIFPDVPIGTIMVVESRPNTATAVVLSTTEEFASGTYIKGLSWVEAPEFLAAIPKCPVQ